jgi:hypothetical protein
MTDLIKLILDEAIIEDDGTVTFSLTGSTLIFQAAKVGA